MAIRLTYKTHELIFDNPSAPDLPCSAVLTMHHTPPSTGCITYITSSSCGAAMETKCPDLPPQITVTYRWDGALSLDGELMFYLDTAWHQLGDNFTGSLVVDNIEMPLRFHVVTPAAGMSYRTIKGKCQSCR